MLKKFLLWLLSLYIPKSTVRYNLNKEFKELVPLGETVVFILDIVRYVKDKVNVSQTQAEILLFIMNNSEAPSLLDIEEYMFTITELHNRRLIKRLVKLKYVEIITVDDQERYVLSDDIINVINSCPYF